MVRIALEQLAVDRVATGVGHSQIEQHGVVRSTLEQRIRFGAGASRIDGVTKADEIAHDRRANRWLVVHHENR